MNFEYTINTTVDDIIDHILERLNTDYLGGCLNITDFCWLNNENQLDHKMVLRVKSKIFESGIAKKCSGSGQSDWMIELEAKGVEIFDEGGWKKHLQNLNNNNQQRNNIKVSDFIIKVSNEFSNNLNNKYFFGKGVPTFREDLKKKINELSKNDKIPFVYQVEQIVNFKREEHSKKCQGPPCQEDDFYERISYIISTEMETLNEKIYENSKVTESINIILKKVFISHSSKDKILVGYIIEMLELIGLGSTNIFCSSYEGYGVTLGENFLERIKDELNDNVLVIFILSPNFYDSAVSLCEMGAAWIKTLYHVPILIPPFEYANVKGVIPYTHGMKIDDPAKYNTLKNLIEDKFQLPIKNNTIWEDRRNKILNGINAFLNV